jgi:hypothetical protein
MMVYIEMQAVIDKYYDKRIQTDKLVINDIANEIYELNKKMLVFGLGYDSNLWYNITNKNTFFIEHNEEYIKINKDINKENIIQYDYNGITVKSSFTMTDKEINSFIIPDELIKNAPYDIIYIDGPTGYQENHPGRLLPIFWSKILSKSGSLIYIDDCERALESMCINRYFNNNKINKFNLRSGCVKILV